MKKEAEGQFGSYGSSDGEKVPKKVKIEHDLLNVISYSESTTLSTFFSPKIDCYIICNIKKLGKHIITLNMLCMRQII